MLSCSAVLDMEWIRIYTSLEYSLPDSTATTNAYGNSPGHTSSYLTEWRVKLVVLPVIPHFWKQVTEKQWLLKCAWNIMINFVSNIISFFHMSHEFFIFLHSHLRKWSSICKKHAAVGTTPLMSISHGLGPSILCRKMEWTRPMREEMDAKVFISRQSRHFCFAVVITNVLFTICTFTWRVNSYVSREQKGIKMRNESTLKEIFCTDYINQSLFVFPMTLLLIIFLSILIDKNLIQSSTLFSYFSTSENGNLEKKWN